MLGVSFVAQPLAERTQIFHSGYRFYTDHGYSSLLGRQNLRVATRVPLVRFNGPVRLPVRFGT